MRSGLWIKYDPTQATPQPPSQTPKQVARIIAGLTLGAAQNPTTLAIVIATGQHPDIHTSCIFLKRFDVSLSMSEIAATVAGILKLDYLRQHLKAVRPPCFDTVKAELVVDGSEVGAAVFAAFQRLFDSKDLDLAEFIGLRVTAGDKLSPPEYLQSATWYRIPKTDLASEMIMALDPNYPRFSMQSTVTRALRNTFKKEMRLFRGRTPAGFGDALIDPRERADDDILLSVMCAVWLANREPDPAPVLLLRTTADEMPEMNHGPRLDMSRVLSTGEMTCHACGYQYTEETSSIWYCPGPGCGTERRALPRAFASI
jgi:hypothetical protein